MVRRLLRRLRPPQGSTTERTASWRAADAPSGPTASEEVRLAPDDAPASVHARLAGHGPLDLVVDASGVEGAARRFALSFLHLRPGGSYRAPASITPDDLSAALDGRAGRNRTSRPLSSTVGEVRRSADGNELRIERTRARTLAVLREEQVDLALAADPARGRVLATLPGAVLTSRCVLRDRSGRSLPDSYVAPELRLREYDDVVCRPKQVVLQRGAVLPDTFRHRPPAGRLRHMSLEAAGADFVWAPRRGPKKRLAGAWFHLDNEHRGFFGHALTEQLARLWALPAARQAHPDVRVLLSANRGRPLAEWEHVLLEAAGIAREQVELIDQPVRVEHLLAATPMFSMPAYVHPAIADTWDRVGRGLSQNASERDWPRRIFCSRRHEKRPCLNRAEVEHYFARHGFEIVFPEDWPLPDQVAMFRAAEVIAGFAGSGLFTSLFCDQTKQLVVIAPDTYRPSNEYMIAAVRGHRLDRVEGRTPEVLPPGVRPDRPLRWPFTVDLAGQRDWLEEILSGVAETS